MPTSATAPPEATLVKVKSGLSHPVSNTVSEETAEPGWLCLHTHSRQLAQHTTLRAAATPPLHAVPQVPTQQALRPVQAAHWGKELPEANAAHLIGMTFHTHPG